MNRPRTAVALLLMLVGLPAGARRASGQELISREAEIKAGIVAILGKFVTWPARVAPAAGAPLKIGVLGKDPFFQDGVNQLDRKLAGQSAVVQRFADSDDYQPCHILVVARSADWDKILPKTQQEAVLVIAQTPGMAQQGAAVNLVVEGNKIVMEINPDAVKRAGLTFAPSLFRLPMVRIVR